MQRIVIVGGGIMGSCIAYHLALAGAAADVVVVEPDPTYEFAATPRAVGGIRLQHALPENVEMSLYGDTVYSDFANQVTGGAVQFDPQFYRMGYLYMVQGAAQVAALNTIADMLEAKGVRLHRLDRAALRSRYPSFHFDDADAATLSPDDGQIDPNAALMGFRRAAEGRGIRYLQDRVVGLDVAAGLVSHRSAGQRQQPGRRYTGQHSQLLGCRRLRHGRREAASRATPAPAVLLRHPSTT